MKNAEKKLEESSLVESCMGLMEEFAPQAEADKGDSNGHFGTAKNHVLESREYVEGAMGSLKRALLELKKMPNGDVNYDFTHDIESAIQALQKIGTNIGGWDFNQEGEGE